MNNHPHSANQHPPTKSRFGLSLPILISIGLHAIILFLLGGVILFPGYVRPSIFSGKIIEEPQAQDMVSPPEDEWMIEENAGGGGTDNHSQEMDFSGLSTDISEQNNIDLTTITSPVSIAPYSIPSGSSINTGDLVGQGLMGSGGGSGGGQGGGIGRGIGAGSSLFGATSSGENMLKGTFYDTKRTSLGRSNNRARAYITIY